MVFLIIKFVYYIRIFLCVFPLFLFLFFYIYKTGWYHTFNLRKTSFKSFINWELRTTSKERRWYFPYPGLRFLFSRKKHCFFQEKYPLSFTSEQLNYIRKFLYIKRWQFRVAFPPRLYYQHFLNPAHSRGKIRTWFDWKIIMVSFFIIFIICWAPFFNIIFFDQAWKPVPYILDYKIIYKDSLSDFDFNILENLSKTKIDIFHHNFEQLNNSEYTYPDASKKMENMMSHWRLRKTYLVRKKYNLWKVPLPRLFYFKMWALSKLKEYRFYFSAISLIYKFKSIFFWTKMWPIFRFFLFICVFTYIFSYHQIIEWAKIRYFFSRRSSNRMIDLQKLKRNRPSFHAVDTRVGEAFIDGDVVEKKISKKKVGFTPLERRIIWKQFLEWCYLKMYFFIAMFEFAKKKFKIVFLGILYYWLIDFYLSINFFKQFFFGLRESIEWFLANQIIFFSYVLIFSLLYIFFLLIFIFLYSHKTKWNKKIYGYNTIKKGEGLIEDWFFYKKRQILYSFIWGYKVKAGWIKNLRRYKKRIQK